MIQVVFILVKGVVIIYLYFFPSCYNWIITRYLELPGSGTKFPTVFGPTLGSSFTELFVYLWTSTTALIFCGLYYVLLSGRFCPPSLLFFFRIFLIIIVQNHIWYLTGPLWITGLNLFTEHNKNVRFSILFWSQSTCSISGMLGMKVKWGCVHLVYRSKKLF